MHCDVYTLFVGHEVPHDDELDMQVPVAVHQYPPAPAQFALAQVAKLVAEQLVLHVVPVEIQLLLFIHHVHPEAVEHAP